MGAEFFFSAMESLLGALSDDPITNDFGLLLWKLEQTLRKLFFLPRLTIYNNSERKFYKFLKIEKRVKKFHLEPKLYQIK